MKVQNISCTQCGTSFLRTNAKQVYCSGACRVSAHRDRHGYQQPIFTYPSIQAIERIREIDIRGLQLIKLYAIAYLLERKTKGETMPLTKLDIDLLRSVCQLHLENDSAENVHKLTTALEPFSELINLVKKIQGDKPNELVRSV